MWPFKAKVIGKTVSVSNTNVIDSGERHSRMWIMHLNGAVNDIIEKIKTATGEPLVELKAALADKQRQIAIHTAMYPNASNDGAYMAEHVASATQPEGTN